MKLTTKLLIFMIASFILALICANYAGIAPSDSAMENILGAFTVVFFFLFIGCAIAGAVEVGKDKRW